MPIHLLMKSMASRRRWEAYMHIYILDERTVLRTYRRDIQHLGALPLSGCYPLCGDERIVSVRLVYN